MNDSIGGMLLLVLVLYSVINVPITAVGSVGSNDTVVVKAGGNVTLRCSAESREEGNKTCLWWNYYPPSYNASMSHGDIELNECDGVYKVHDRNGRIAAKTEGAVSVLSITDIQLEDAGQYTCQNRDDGEEEILSKELIVIDDHPRCSSTFHKYFDNKTTNGSANLQGNKMELHCEVRFNGSLIASDQCILEWKIVGREDVLINSSKCIFGDNSVKSTLTLDATFHSNDTSYVCVVRGSDVEQYSCETGQIETPLTASSEDVPTVQPEPLTKSPNKDIELCLAEFLREQVFNRTLVDQFLDLQQKMFCIVSELANTQRKLLTVERKRLRLEEWRNRTI